MGPYTVSHAIINRYHSMGIFNRRQIHDNFIYFSPENMIWHFMQIVSSPLETICMKCQRLFSGTNKENISSAVIFTQSA